MDILLFHSGFVCSAVNPFFLVCVPSQRGMRVDAPHRRHAWTTFPLTVARLGLFSVDFITTLRHAPECSMTVRMAVALMVSSPWHGFASPLPCRGLQA